MSALPILCMVRMNPVILAQLFQWYISPTWSSTSINMDVIWLKAKAHSSITNNGSVFGKNLIVVVSLLHRLTKMGLRGSSTQATPFLYGTKSWKRRTPYWTPFLNQWSAKSWLLSARIEAMYALNFGHHRFSLKLGSVLLFFKFNFDFPVRPFLGGWSLLFYHVP